MAQFLFASLGRNWCERTQRHADGIGIPVIGLLQSSRDRRHVKRVHPGLVVRVVVVRLVGVVGFVAEEIERTDVVRLDSRRIGFVRRQVQEDGMGEVRNLSD